MEPNIEYITIYRSLRKNILQIEYWHFAVHVSDKTGKHTVYEYGSPNLNVLSESKRNINKEIEEVVTASKVSVDPSIFR